MTFLTMRKRVAENLGILGDDEATILPSKVTSTGIDNHLSELYLDELFPLLSENYPDDFKQFTYKLNTWTATGTVSASSTSTTLVTTADTFTNSMEGFTAQNITDGETAKIVTYNSATSVTLDTTIGDTWDGDTIYVLGNEFTFSGDISDMKEFLGARIKYSASDLYLTPCIQVEKSREIINGGETFSQASPRVYLTMINVSGTPTKAIGFLPYPTSYLGAIEIDYIGKPPTPSTGSTPMLEVIGISDAIIKGTTAWGFRNIGDNKAAMYWDTLYEKAKASMLMNYRPKHRQDADEVLLSPWANSVIAGGA